MMRRLQVPEIDNCAVNQPDSEITMALGNEDERRAAVHTASSEKNPFKRKLQVMGVGQSVQSASYKRVPLPIQMPEFR